MYNKDIQVILHSRLSYASKNPITFFGALPRKMLIQSEYLNKYGIYLREHGLPDLLEVYLPDNVYLSYQIDTGKIIVTKSNKDIILICYYKF